MTFNIWRISYFVRFFRIPEYGQLFLIMLLGSLAIVSSAYAAGDYQTYSPRTLINSKWGLGKEEFGLIKGIEQETSGPRTFSLDKSGNIYIFDTVKQNIKKFSAEGTYLATLGSEIYGSVMAIDDENHIFVLNNSVANSEGPPKQILYEYSPAGDLIKGHEISRDIKLLEGAGQRIMIDDFGDLFVNKDQKVYKIGVRTKQTDNAQGSTLATMEQKQQVTSKKYGMPGKTRDSRFQIGGSNLRVLSSEGALLEEISIEGGAFLGQDNQGSVYIEGVRITKDEQGHEHMHLEVKKYDLTGHLLATVELPIAYYTSSVYKNLDVDDYGNIYQMLTTSRGVEVIKWEQK